ncbi:MAG: MFS transporter [Elusimicrobia bacterium]|nr:MFS transporter [Elusimicrobiota bacterium]
MGLFRSLRHQAYRRLFIGQGVSFCGSWMQHTAQGWLVYRLTGDPFQLGLVAFLGQAPVLFLGNWAGTLADRLPRRRIVAVTQTLMMLQAAVLAGLTLSGRVTAGLVLVMSALLGCLVAFDFPARQLLVGGSVPAADRHNALALQSGSVNAMRVIGPSLAGFVIHAWGEGPCFLLNAVSYILLLGVLVGMPDGEPTSAGGPETGGLAGLRAVLKPEALRQIFIALGVFGLLGLPYTMLMPLFAEDVLHSGPRGLGILLASAGTGATAAALYLAWRPSAEGLERLLADSTLVFGLGLMVFSRMRSLPLACAVLIVLGGAMVILLAGANTLIQELAPPRLAGRAIAVFAMFVMGLGPFGSLALGALAARAGAPAAAAAAGLGLVCVGMASLRRLPASVRLARAGKL